VMEPSFLRSQQYSELDLGNRVVDFSFPEFRTLSSKSEIAQQQLDYSNSLVVIALRKESKQVP